MREVPAAFYERIRKMIGKRLKTIRRKAGDSQERLAERLYVAPATICSWEQGRSIPDGQKLVAICKYYNVSADYLLGISDVDSRYEQRLHLEELNEEELEKLLHYKQFLIYSRKHTG